MKSLSRLYKVLIAVAGASILTLAIIIVAFSLHGKSDKESNDKSIISRKVQADDFIQAGVSAGAVSEKPEKNEPDLNPEDAVISADLNENQTTAAIKLEGISSAQAVTVAVWSKAGEQDDLVWYDMKKSDEGVFNVDVPIKNHHTDGDYKADAYVVRKDGSKYIIANTGFIIEGPVLEGASFENVNNTNGAFDIKLSGAKSPSGVKSAKVKVYPVDNSGNSHTYEAQIDSSGMVVISGNVSNHGYLSGQYNAEVTIVDNNEISKKLLDTSTTFNLPQMSISQSMNENSTQVKLSVNNLLADSVSQMKFDVYSKEKGKDDLVSYPGTQMSPTSYEATAVIANHHTAGEYQVDVFGVRAGKKQELLGSITFTVSAPNAGALTIPVKNDEDEYFKASVSGASSKAGITEIKFKVVRNSDGKESWYNSDNPSSGSGEIIVDVKDQTESVDSYSITSYVTDANGIQTIGGGVEASMTMLNNGRYKIMGPTRTNVAQMARYFNANGSYPGFYANTDAPTIEAFCQIFYEEAAAEGVRAEVAFCQTMKETGYLKFGGDVSINQLNFAGIGATGNGQPGNSFGSVREGVRAQIQHLKAYASTDSLNQACVDPRFQYVKRGSSIYVEWLGIQDNPNGGGWAAGAGYGPSIVNSYIRKLFSY